MKRGWVIKVCQNRNTYIKDYYYSGSIYRHLGEYYGVFQDIDEAKVYTSQKRAVNAMEKLKVKVWNWDSMEVELLEDEEEWKTK